MDRYPDDLTERSDQQAYRSYKQYDDYMSPSSYSNIPSSSEQSGTDEGNEQGSVFDSVGAVDYTNLSYYGVPDEPLMQPYLGPQSLEGYTHDAGEVQRDSAREGHYQSGKKRKRLAGLGGLGAAILGWLAKFNGLVLFAKFGMLGLSALISMAAYALISGWAFGIGLVVLLFIHEMGHAIVMKLKKIPIGGMIFIPLMGAMVTMKQMPQNAKDEAEVGIAGPIAGALASGVCLWIAQMHPSMPGGWAALAYFGFLMNLFNLVPIIPYDGGRVLAAIDRRVWIVGFLLLLGYQIWSWYHGNFSFWLLMFVVIAATQLWSRGLAPEEPEAQVDYHAYYDVPMRSRVILTVLYFSLASVLYLGMSIAHQLAPIR
ncbi:site-2 protease family protein [Tengunoibacter tsumagoiensis]|uniref:Peptidase M50 domain-containing protein n=1 Tax=Tengunoibacter tsumagoiensis TaxID=2014871 RepID=A0A401ZYX6_9CHLR|nr:site-2 protease family protein [Tengunoibacter tsumagoiensis]GCE12041.1 hypothetical protein KTT_19000 [Tengunoibacter tsumagoiensis]